MSDNDNFDPWKEAIDLQKETKKKQSKSTEQEKNTKKNTEQEKKTPPPHEGIKDYIKDFYRFLGLNQKKTSTGSSSSSGFNFFNSGGGSTKNILIGLSVLIFAGWLSSGFFWLSERQLAVVLRFGRLDRILNPGLQYHWPSPIEKKIIVSTEVINTYQNVSPNISLKNLDSLDQTLVLTGDENMVHVQYALQWKIKDIKNFLFSTTNPQSTIQVAAESSVREIISQTMAKDVLTQGREEIARRIHDLLQKILDSYELGVYIVNFQLQRVDPPSAVLDAFYDMQASRIHADRLVREAQGYANSIVPKAKGQVSQIMFDAQGQYEKNINEAQSEAQEFLQALEVASSNKALYLKRRQTKNLCKLLKKTQKAIILDGKLANNTLPFLDLKKENQSDASSKKNKGKSE